MEPPSPESRENPLESSVPALGSSPAKPHSSPGPQMITSVEMPDPKSTSHNPASSEGNRRTIGKWFKIVTKPSHNPMLHQTRSVPPPQSCVPPQMKATPPNEKPSTMAPGKRQKVSVLSSVDTGHGYMTTRFSGRLQGPLLDQRLVHASYPFMNPIAYCASQKKKTAKTTPHSEAGPSNVQTETKPESSGARNNVNVSVHFVRLAAGTHNSS